VDWINGILQGSKSKYYEGMSVPERILMQSIPPNSGAANPNLHTLNLKVLATKAGLHAYDFLTSWEQAVSAPPIVISPVLGYLMNQPDAGPMSERVRAINHRRVQRAALG